MNKFIGMGRLTADAETRYNNGKAVSRFTLAVDRRLKKDGEQTADFIGCVAFGKTAEFIEKWGKKGVKFAVEGRVQTGSYTNKDGQKVYTTDVVVESVEFAEGKNSVGATVAKEEEPRFVNIPEGIDEELPFN